MPIAKDPVQRNRQIEQQREMMRGNSFRLGIPHTEEMKKHLSEVHAGDKNAFYGKKHSEETMKRIALSRPDQSGSKHPMWKGGISSRYRIKTAPRPKPEACEICGSLGRDFKKGLCLDHNHSTGEFRGWICTRCNATIGMVRENLEILTAISDYIKKSMNQS